MMTEDDKSGGAGKTMPTDGQQVADADDSRSSSNTKDPLAQLISSTLGDIIMLNNDSI